MRCARARGNEETGKHGPTSPAVELACKHAGCGRNRAGAAATQSSKASEQNRQRKPPGGRAKLEKGPRRQAAAHKLTSSAGSSRRAKTSKSNTPSGTRLSRNPTLTSAPSVMLRRAQSRRHGGAHSGQSPCCDQSAKSSCAPYAASVVAAATPPGAPWQSAARQPPCKPRVSQLGQSEVKTPRSNSGHNYQKRGWATSQHACQHSRATRSSPDAHTLPIHIPRKPAHLNRRGGRGM
jgi:hypothetical protein